MIFTTLDIGVVKNSYYEAPPWFRFACFWTFFALALRPLLVPLCTSSVPAGFLYVNGALGLRPLLAPDPFSTFSVTVGILYVNWSEKPDCGIGLG